MKARGERRRFNLGPRVMSRGFWVGKHNRSSRHLGLRKSLILIVYHVPYEAHNYDSVGREICIKTVVCFDQFNLLCERGENLCEWLQLVRVETEQC